MPLLQILTAFAGSLGFAFVFRLRRQLLFSAALGGGLCWCIYLLCADQLGSIFVSGLIASAAATAYAELLARLQHAPATLFYIPAVIPLVPGSSLYYCMSSAAWGAWEDSRRYGQETIQYALAIAAGMSLVWSAVFMIRKLAGMRKNNERKD